MSKTRLNNPILIAAWPGMGQVALTACYYLIAKLGLEFRAEYATNGLFEVDHVAIESGMVQPFRYPRNQFFTWHHPDHGNDLILFIGEAQPPQGRYNFCRRLIDYVQSEGVSRIFTFAALASASQLNDPSRVVGVATDTDTLHELIENRIGLLESGNISGMNGILLGVAAERKIPGGCLLGEIPAQLINLPNPKASHAVLTAFGKLTGMEIDLADLQLEIERVNKFLAGAIRHLEQQGQIEETEEEETFIPDPVDNGKLTVEDKEMLERLFDQASHDRSRAFELKRELDRLDVFREYEDRFLDLFRKENGDSQSGGTK